MKVRQLQQRRGWAWSLAVAVVKPALLATTTHRWVDADKLPASGGCLLVLNHVSHADPLTTAHLVYDHGRLPRYLAKSGLFRSRFFGFFLRAAGQIPVERLSRNAVGAYDAAVAAVRAGECVVIYPEGTITRDPDGWPMTGKSGAARVALATGCPVVPIGQWGAQALLPAYAVVPRLVGRTPITMRVGDPVPLADLVALPGERQTPAVVTEATTRIMDAITALVADVRGEPAPGRRYDMRTTGDRRTGNPRRHRRRRPGRPGGTPTSTPSSTPTSTPTSKEHRP